jgi:hypothetical protein
MARDPQNGSRLEEGTSLLDEDHGIQAISRQPTPGKESLAGRRLHGREPQCPGGIEGDEELHTAMAEITNTVEQDNSVVGVDPDGQLRRHGNSHDGKRATMIQPRFSREDHSAGTPGLGRGCLRTAC